MVTTTADGEYALVADEDEPTADYSVDPEGSMGVVKLPEDVAAAAQDDAHTAGFRAFAGTLADKGVHILGQVGASTSEAQNREPEYIATAEGKAYVTLQENNAVAVVDIATATVENVFPPVTPTAARSASTHPTRAAQSPGGRVRSRPCCSPTSSPPTPPAARPTSSRRTRATRATGRPTPRKRASGTEVSGTTTVFSLASLLDAPGASSTSSSPSSTAGVLTGRIAEAKIP
nr:hypothetical protein [Corynebacterium senegalense]